MIVRNSDFYATAAQVIPILLIATVLEQRLRPRQDPLDLYGLLAFLATVVFVVGEASALDALREHRATALRETIVGLSIALGLALVVLSMFPGALPPDPNRRRLFEGLTEDQRARLGGVLKIGLAAAALLGMLALVIFDD